MATQSLRGLASAGPMHGRGDRSGGSTGGDPLDEELAFKSFNPADILACGECGGRLRLVATIAEPAVIAKTLKHLGLRSSTPIPEPARPPPWLPGFEEQ